MEKPMPVSDPSEEYLRRFVESGAPETFRRLVDLHVGLVHSVAQRRLGGLAHLAEDVTQAVFTLLARKAARLPRGLVLAAWLHRQAVRCALNTLRSENRRRAREQQAAAMHSADSSSAWQLLAPHLDESLAALPERDRALLILRYYEDRDAAEISAHLGISREAAQKRIERAVESLRRRLTSRTALPLTAALLAGAMSGRTVQAAPAGLAARVSAQALQSAGAGAGGPAWWRPALAAAPLTILATLAAGAAAGWYAADSVRGWFSTPPQHRKTASMLAVPRGNDAGVRKESLLAALERLGSAPRNYRTELEFAVLMQRVQEEPAALCSRALAVLSPLARDRVMRRLANWWAARDVAAALDFTLDHCADPANGLTNTAWKLYNDWLDLDSAAAASWLLGRLARREPFGGKGHDSDASLAGQTIQHLARESAARTVAFYTSLPSALQRQTVGKVADDAGGERWRVNWPSAKWRELGDLLAQAVAADRAPADVLRRVAGRWSFSDRTAAQQWVESLPDPAARSSAALGLVIADPGLMDFDKPRLKQDDQLAALSKAVSDSHDPSATLAKIVTLWPLKDDQIVPWLEAQNAGAAADAAWSAAARRIAKPQFRSFVQGRESGPPPHRQALDVAARIMDDTQRELLENGLLRRWHQRDAAAAAAWLQQSGWDADRIAQLQARLTAP